MISPANPEKISQVKTSGAVLDIPPDPTPDWRRSLTKRIALTRSLFALVDDEDYAELANHKWNATAYGYATRTHHDRFAPGLYRAYCVFMHRQIMNAPRGLEVDHVNGDTLDNRRENLRLCTRSENMRNRRKQRAAGRATPSSRYKGVAWSKNCRNWTAKIKRNGKTESLGSFPEERQAALAYDCRARQIFGDFARLNFPDVHDYSNLPQRRTRAASGYRGVGRRNGRWVAVIYVGRKIRLGYFDDIKSAALAYDEAAKMYRGERAILNFPGGA